REGVAALGPAFGDDEPGALQVLEDLLEEARRDRLALRDVLDLRRLTVVVEGDVEDRADSVAAFARELHRARLCVFPSDLSTTAGGISSSEMRKTWRPPRVARSRIASQRSPKSEPAPAAILGCRLVGVMPGRVLTSSTYSFSSSVTRRSTRA